MERYSNVDASKILKSAKTVHPSAPPSLSMWVQAPSKNDPEDYDEEKEMTVEYEYSRGQKGRYCGPPEKCYPDEPEEFSITAVIDPGTKEDVLPRFKGKELQQLEQQALQKLRDEMEPDYEIDRD